MEDATQQIDLILQSLRDLHQKFTLAQKSSSGGELEHNEKVANNYKFDNEKDQCLQSLKELFLNRIKENKEKRLRQNQRSVRAIRDVPRTIWVTKIMCYLHLSDAFRLGQVCIFFNQITKSPLFIKFFVTLNEKTKIDVSANPGDIHQSVYQ